MNSHISKNLSPGGSWSPCFGPTLWLWAFQIAWKRLRKQRGPGEPNLSKQISATQFLSSYRALTLMQRCRVSEGLRNLLTENLIIVPLTALASSADPSSSSTGIEWLPGETHTHPASDPLLSCLIIRVIYSTRAQNYNLIGCHLLNEEIMSSPIILI